jgi:hypothetical protein
MKYELATARLVIASEACAIQKKKKSNNLFYLCQEHFGFYWLHEETL